MDTAGEFRKVASRYRRIAGGNEDGRRGKKAADAAFAILARDAGLIPKALEPSADALAEWAGQPDHIENMWAGCCAFFLLGASHRNIDFPVVNPLCVTSEYRGGPEKIIAGVASGDDWRIQCEKSADVCDRIADAIERSKVPTPMSKESVGILLYIDSQFPRLCTFDDIQADKVFADFPARNTVSEHMKILEQLGFVHRPSGPKKGATLTDEGRAEVARRR
jgi:hypothetical protein